MEVMLRNANMIQLQLEGTTEVQVNWLGGTARLERDKTVNCAAWRVTYRPPMVIIQPTAGGKGIAELTFSSVVNAEISLLNVGRNRQIIDHTSLEGIVRITILPDRVTTGGVQMMSESDREEVQALRHRLETADRELTALQTEAAMLRSENEGLQRAKTELEGQIVRDSIPNDTLRQLRARHRELSDERAVVEQEIQSLTMINQLLEEDTAMLQAELEGLKLRHERCTFARAVITDDSLSACEAFAEARSESAASIERMEAALVALTGELDKTRGLFKTAVTGDGHLHMPEEAPPTEECDD